MSDKPLSYKSAGVDIDEKNKTFAKLETFVSQRGSRVLNKMGAFASLIDIKFDDEYEEPVLVFKLEEPGTKQKLAHQHGKLPSVAHDMINHLVNDIIVMGAKPLAVQDLIVCGQLKDEIITPLVREMSRACENNDCSLVGGETSEQPGVIDPDTHILGASIIGVAEKNRIIDGSKIAKDDLLIAFSANGLHTNGYSLIRKLLDEDPKLAQTEIDGKSFIDLVLEPHPTYYPLLKEMLPKGIFKGLAHITGGGIAGNLSRIIPEQLQAQVDLRKIKTLPLFKFIKEYTKLEDDEMLRTFNCGVGLIAVVSPYEFVNLIRLTDNTDIQIYDLGTVGNAEESDPRVAFTEQLNWDNLI